VHILHLFILLVYYCEQGTGSLPLLILEEAGQECRKEEPAVAVVHIQTPDYSPITTASSWSSSPEPNPEMVGLLGSEGTYESTSTAYPTFKIVGDNIHVEVVQFACLPSYP